jgi:C-terminal processing protease CtpA/Prc
MCGCPVLAGFVSNSNGWVWAHNGLLKASTVSGVERGFHPGYGALTYPAMSGISPPAPKQKSFGSFLQKRTPLHSQNMQPRAKRSVVVAALLVCLANPAAAGVTRIERLAGLARLWSAIAYFHPYLAYRADIDLDRAVTNAIRAVEAAHDPADYAAAIDAMLHAIGDPVTHIISPDTTPDTSPHTRQPSFHTTPDGILVVDMTHYADFLDFPGTRDKLAALTNSMATAKAMIFDLRPSHPPTEIEQGLASDAINDSDLPGLLATSPRPIPGERRRMHVGYVPQIGAYSGDYSSGFYLQGHRAILPATGAHRIPAVFLVNENSDLPDLALGLQATGDGAIVLEGDAGADPSVSVQRIALPDGVEAQIRLGERIAADGTAGFVPNLRLPSSSIAGPENPAFKAALALARRGNFSPPERPRLPAQGAPPPDKTYADTQFPSAEYRVLAAFRLWAVIDTFYIYTSFIGEDWDAVLRQFIPRMEQAGTALEYNLAVAEMLTHIHDSHGRADSPVLRAFRGPAKPPVHVRIIEGVPAITGFIDEAAAATSGLSIGDVILQVDGRPAGARIAEQMKYTAASTPQAGLLVATEGRLLSGPDKSIATLAVRGANGLVRTVTVPRKLAYAQADREDRTGDSVRVMPGNIGYADLARLTVPQVDAMFDKFRTCPAIIFDDRGYPNGTAWEIAPRLTDRSDVAAALFKRRDPMQPNLPNGENLHVDNITTMVQRLPLTNKWRYHGKTVLLIDERTVSQAEHTGLFLRAANGTTFIGSPTTGANGDITYLTVPGGITLRFSGQGVWHPDGTPLQRTGLQPDILVRPTLAGLRAHRDEVLEKALATLTATPDTPNARPSAPSP